jgi:Domain of unknown function (DUF397)
MHPAPSRAAWRASSHSGANGDCVQVASRPPALVGVRDSKNPSGPMLAFTADQWQTFTTGLKDYPARLNAWARVFAWAEDATILLRAGRRAGAVSTNCDYREFPAWRNGRAARQAHKGIS